MNKANAAQLSGEQEFLTFILNGEEYGVDILCVQEIRVWTSVTELPDVPAFFKGVINLRGIIVPIVDLRQRFGQSKLEYNANTVTIILRPKNKRDQFIVGVVVDAVSEVYKFETSAIKAPPKIGRHINNAFIQGMASVEDRLVILLNTDALLDADALFNADQSDKSTNSQLANAAMQMHKECDYDA